MATASEHHNHNKQKCEPFGTLSPRRPYARLIISQIPELEPASCFVLIGISIDLFIYSKPIIHRQTVVNPSTLESSNRNRTRKCCTKSRSSIDQRCEPGTWASHSNPQSCISPRPSPKSQIDSHPHSLFSVLSYFPRSTQISPSHSDSQV